MAGTQHTEQVASPPHSNPFDMIIDGPFRRRIDLAHNPFDLGTAPIKAIWISTPGPAE